MPDNLKVGVSVDVGETAKLQAAAEETTSAIGRMAKSFMDSGLSAEEAASALKNMGFAAKEASAAVGLLGTATKKTGQDIEQTETKVTALTRALAYSTARLASNELGAGQFGFALARVGSISSSVAPVLAMAFPVFAATMLVTVIGDMVEKYEQWSRLGVETTQHMDSLNASIEIQTDKLELENVKLDNQINKLSGVPQNRLKEQAIETRIAFEELGKAIQDDLIKIDEIFSKGHGLFGEMMGHANVKKSGEQLQPFEREYQMALRQNDVEAQRNVLLREQMAIEEMIAAEKAQHIQERIGPRGITTTVGRAPDQEALNTYADVLNIVKKRMEDILALKEAEGDRAELAKIQETAEMARKIKELAGIEQSASEARIAARMKEGEIIAKIRKIEDEPVSTRRDRTMDDITQQRDTSIAAAEEKKAAVLKGADEEWAVQQAYFDKVEKADSYNAQLTAQHASERAKKEEEYAAKVREANLKALLDVAEAERRYQIQKSALLEKGQREAERLAGEQMGQQEKVAEEGFKVNLAHSAEQIKDVQDMAALQRISRGDELSQLRRIGDELEINKQKAVAAIKAEMAAEEAKRTAGTFGEKGTTGYGESVNRQIGLQRQLDELIKQFNRDLDHVADTTKKLDTSWSTFWLKMHNNVRDFSSQFRVQMQSSINAVNEGMSRAVTSWISNNKSFGASMRELGVEILNSFVSMFIKIGLQWVETQIMMAIFGKVTQAASAEARVVSEAAVAGAGGVASMAAAPFPIDLTAPAFGAAMAAAALSYAPLAAFERGGIVTANLHEGEMVLPAHLSNFIQAAASGPGASRTAETGGSPTTGHHFHFHANVNAIDSRGVKEMLHEHSEVFARAAARHLRRLGAVS